MNDTPETQEAVERWRQGKINIFDEMARLERQRDDYKEMWESWRSENRCNLAAVSLLKDECAQLEQKLSEAKRKLKEARDTARWLYQHGMATLIEGASRNEWIKETIP